MYVCTYVCMYVNIYEITHYVHRTKCLNASIDVRNVCRHHVVFGS